MQFPRKLLLERESPFRLHDFIGARRLTVTGAVCESDSECNFSIDQAFFFCGRFRKHRSIPELARVKLGVYFACSNLLDSVPNLKVSQNLGVHQTMGLAHMFFQ